MIVWLFTKIITHAVGTVCDYALDRARRRITLVLDLSRNYVVCRGRVTELDSRRRYIVANGEVMEYDSAV